METGKTRDRQNQVTVDLQGLKAPWLEWCKARRLTPSDALRRTIAKVLDKAPPAPSSVMLPVIERPVARHEIALTESEEVRVVALAQSEGLSVTKWIVALIRSRLTGTAQFGQAELEALTESNRRILQIGKNLNQITKSLNVRGDSVLYDIAMIEGLEAEIRAHTKKVSNLMTGNAVRWKIHGR